MGSPSKDRWKQAHLPGIDAIACTGIIDNSVKVVALQIKSAMNLNYSSIDNTIWKFLVHRKESGSVLRTFLSGCFSTYLDGTLKITMTTDRNNSIDVTQISEEALKNTLQIEKFHSLNFRLCDDQKRKIEGVVDLYILVIGSFNTNILNHYPGVRFIWGLNQLSSLMGEKSLDYLKLNTRFRIISICRMELDFDLTQYDNNYKKVTVYSKVAKRYATYSCLNDTEMDDFRRYFTNKFNLHSISEIDFFEYLMVIIIYHTMKKEKKRLVSRYNNLDYNVDLEDSNTKRRKEQQNSKVET